MVQHFAEELVANIGQGAVAHPCHVVGVAVGKGAPDDHDPGKGQAHPDDGAIHLRARVQEGGVRGKLLGVDLTAALENNAGHFREDERHERGDHAEESAAGDAHDETPAIRLYVAIKPAVGPPADADHLPTTRAWRGAACDSLMARVPPEPTAAIP